MEKLLKAPAWRVHITMCQDWRLQTQLLRLAYNRAKGAERNVVWDRGASGEPDQRLSSSAKWQGHFTATARASNFSRQKPSLNFCVELQNRLLNSVGEDEGGMFWENSIETYILSRVKETTSPGWMQETSAQGWCTGKTQRDGMGREAGGGIGMGNTCKSMAASCQCMAKTTTIL